MDDNATPHRVRITNQFRQEGIDRMLWPAKSPDLNPLEHLWGYLKYREDKRIKPTTTFIGLDQILRREWAAIDQGRIRRLVNMSPKEIKINRVNEEFSEGEVVGVIAGTQNPFTCVSKGSKPGADMKWTVGDTLIDPTPPITNDPNSGDNRLFDSTSIYDYEALWDHHQASITCNATNHALPTGINTYITLDVKVPPMDASVNLYDSNPYNALPSGAVREGVEHTFHCDVMGTRPESEITWQRGNEAPSGTIRREADGELTNTFGSLKFTPIRGDHKQTLQCEASIDVSGAVTITKQLTLDVYGPPDTPSITGGSDLTENMASSDISCNAAEAFSDDGSITWYKNDVVIESGEGDNIPNGDRYDIRDSLLLTPTRSDNRNTIRCEVQHGTLAGPSYPADETTIDVKFCPQRVNITQCLPVEVGQQTTLSCTSSSSNPATTLVWYEGNTKKDSTHQQANTTSDYYGTSSTLDYTTRVIKREDYGNLVFKCCSENLTRCTDTCSDVCSLNVLYPPEMVVITKSSADPILEGTSLTLSCGADGNPDPNQFEWFKDDLPNDIGDGTNVLQFNPISRDDAGFYDCKASNGISPDGTTEEGLPIPVHYSPVIDKKNNQRGVNPGGNIMMDCLTNGLPNPQVSWKNQKERQFQMTPIMTIYETIKEDDGVHGTLFLSQLLIENVAESDYGNYSCESINSIGGPDIFIIYLTGPTVPGSVTNLTITASTLTSLSINWNAGYSGGEDLYQWFIVDFRMYNNNQPGNWEGETEVKNVVTQYEVTGLSEDTLYDIRVFSVNDIGKSIDGELVQGITGYVPNPPTSVVITDVTTTSLSVQWEAGDPGRVAQWFLIDYRTYPQGEFTDDPIKVTEGITQHILTGLTSNTKYEILILSENKYGINKEGATTQKTTDGLPIPHSSNLGVIIGSTTGVIIVILLVIIVVLVLLLRKQRSERSRDHDQATGSRKMRITDTELASLKETRHHGGTDNSAFIETDLNKQVEEPYVNYLLNEFVFPRENLHIQNELGHGEFGQVLLGMATGIVSRERETKVAVKTLKDTFYPNKDNANDEAKQQLVKEFNLMKSLMPALVNQKNRNVIQLLGGCMDEDPLYMILEYMKNGNLKTLLRESRTIGDGTYGNLFAGSKSFTPTQLIGFAHQVANGMAFLARQKCIHRDLAARNVLLNESFECKISDFGLAEDVMNGDVYRRQNECRLPLRWMAIESILGDVHTTESDVWSFGVLLWEIVTLGSRPYPKLKGDAIRKLLKNGQRMPQPKHCSEQLYNIMLACWEKEPSKRPSFEHLMKLLDEILEGQNGYLSLANFETKLYEDVSLPAPNEKV
ncbi:LOW QUALITY PROTEIN: uncharacterized protein [Amphiura filiformis]|uniref:LOW QUALITY PROTEIN: uncharacterized protein n=1 Tax=Amphiura filiformis TaxID=82378 RepID=UPI003B21E3AE